VTFKLPAESGRKKLGWNDASFGALVAAFPNTGFMGVPLLVALLGAKAAGPAIATIIVDILLTTSLCLALSRLDVPDDQGDAKRSASQAARMALKGVVSNPLPWSIALGALASAVGFALPKPLMGTVSLLADAAPPVALFTIGAMLARSQINSTQRASLLGYVPVAIIKLVVHPVLVGVVGLGAIAMGLPLDRFALTVVVLVAALPSNSNAALLAERFGADNGRIARIILLTTALAFFSFSAAVALLT
ncbi:MAG: AEC family transporter, partial [Polaromonas sp.]|nr:AEC family transporter [Polaromonas sp.]